MQEWMQDMTKKMMLIPALFAALTLAGPGLAERPDGPAPDSAMHLAQANADGADRSWKKKEKKPKRRRARREKIRRKMQTFVVVELSSALDLDEKRALKLADAVREMGKEREAAHKGLRKEMMALRTLVEEGAGDRKLKAQLAQVKSARKKAQSMDDRLFEKTASFLSVKEQAQLTLAMPEVMKQMRRMAGKAGRGKRGGEGRRGPRNEGSPTP
jgi:hypothetical protein